MEFKVQKTGIQSTSSAFKKYQDLVLGTRSLWFFFKYEIIMLLFAGFPGALGYLLRKWTYPFIFGAVGKNVLFGRGIVSRHPKRIFISEGAIIDDHCVLDAKGDSNRGITIGSGVYIGRQSILYCKNGNITLKDRANIGHRCIVFSSHELVLEEGSLVAADCYLMSGGTYDYTSAVPFVEQEGSLTRGPLIIGKNCWLGAKVVVLDGAGIGEGAVIGAGAVVTKPVPARSVVAGVPARVIKQRVLS